MTRPTPALPASAAADPPVDADGRPALPAGGTADTIVHAYHRRTKHQLQRYAAGPDTLDWDAQPAAFRRWPGAELIPLPLRADTLATPWRALVGGEPVAPQRLDRDGLALLLELSLALSAWKQAGPDRWALRVNPSSGNLHPVEAYALVQGLPGLADGLYHYAPQEHGLELRCAWRPAAGAGRAPVLALGLSAIHWREAWKYGERAFRYSQLDLGHAHAALAWAAAALGWRLRAETLAPAALAGLLGLDRPQDLGPAEPEEAELLLRVLPSADDAAATGPMPALGPPPDAVPLRWFGQAQRLDPRPMYRWPVIAAVSAATQEEHAAPPPSDAERPTALLAPPERGAAPDAGLPAATLIRRRRSAQRFERRATIEAAALWRLLAGLRATEPGAAAQAAPARVHAVVYAHRVAGLAPGAYLLPRSAAGLARLRQRLRTGGQWLAVPEAPPTLGLLRLAQNPALAGTLRTLSCHQAIAADAVLAFSLVAEFDTALAAGGPAAYRALLQEAGRLGQALYLHAEAEGLRGTGIGCYFDDAVHQLLGLADGDTGVQVLYHFSVGQPVDDPRLVAEPPYAGRAAVAPLNDSDLDPARSPAR